MKPGAPPEVTPLADKLQRQPPGAAARGWMSTTPVAAPAPLFSGGYTAPIIDHADIERRVAEGLARAREEGERQGWAKAEEDVAAAIARLGDALSQVQATAREMARPYAGELVELAFIIARGLVGAEVKRDPAPLVRLIERCLDEVTGESSITLRLHPADRAILMVLRPELALTDLRILEDESIARGGCAVESARRLVDARVEERLDNVRDGVRQLLEEADLADG
jgi:flagellar assembly protein FliH